LILGDADKAKIAKVILGDVLNNIKQQKQADGSPLRRNRPSTTRRKEAEGKPPLSLVDEEHRFVKPANWDCSWNDKNLTIAPGDRGGSPPLKELNESVQLADYVGWFGTTAEAVAAVKVLLISFIRSALRRANRG
jgi:hypothetical protein